MYTHHLINRPFGSALTFLGNSFIFRFTQADILLKRYQHCINSHTKRNKSTSVPSGWQCCLHANACNLTVWIVKISIRYILRMLSQKIRSFSLFYTKQPLRELLIRCEKNVEGKHIIILFCVIYSVFERNIPTIMFPVGR